MDIVNVNIFIIYDCREINHFCTEYIRSRCGRGRCIYIYSTMCICVKKERKSELSALIERNHSKSGATEAGSPLFTHRWDGKYSGWHLREVSVLRERSGSGGSDEFVWQMLLEYVLSTVLRRGPWTGIWVWLEPSKACQITNCTI